MTDHHESLPVCLSFSGHWENEKWIDNMAKKYHLGLALSGGSAKGYAHIGVLKYMHEIGLKPDIIAGTSAGALVGALYSDGYTPEDIMELMSDVKLRSMTSLRPIISGGLLNTTPFKKFVDEHLAHHRLEDLPIPLRVVATNLDLGEPRIFTEGELSQIVLASCSIPVLFNPVEIDGVTYVDGGLFRNFPVSVIRDGCDVVIGMNLGPWGEPNYKRTIVSVAVRSWFFVFRQNTLIDKEACDILLESTDLMSYGPFETHATQQMADIGYRVAKAELTPERLKALGL